MHSCFSIIASKCLEICEGSTWGRCPPQDLPCLPSSPLDQQVWSDLTHNHSNCEIQSLLWEEIVYLSKKLLTLSDMCYWELGTHIEVYVEGVKLRQGEEYQREKSVFTQRHSPVTQTITSTKKTLMSFRNSDWMSMWVRGFQNRRHQR